MTRAAPAAGEIIKEGYMFFVTSSIRKLVFVGCQLLLAWLLTSCTALEGAESQGVESVPAAPQEKEIKTNNMVLTAPGRIKKRTWSGQPLVSFVSSNFVGSDLCAECHDLLTDVDGNDMSILNHWRSTMMANAAKDPFWQAKVSSEVARNPALQQVIESKCATCHMPMAWTEAGVLDQQRAILEYGFLRHTTKLHDAAMDGVSCSLCHQIKDYGLGTKKSFSGKFALDTDTDAPERKIYGPFKNPVQKPMRTSIGYTPVYGQHTNDSALCGTCHTLFTPYVDAAGNVVGEFPEQTPYLEWKHSAYGVSANKRYDIGENTTSGRICQECHMPHSKAGGVKIAKWAPPEVKAKDHFSQHHFVGGNVFMMNVLQDNSVDLQLTASTDKFDDTKNRTLRQLQGASAELSLVDARRQGNALVVTVQVESGVGHKFPTGFPSRNLWLHLTVVDANGRIVFESGKPQPDGRITGNNADEENLSFEPHYDVITSSDQVQIYEAVMGNTDGEVTHTLLRTARYLKDNRLLPRGFDKNTAGAEIDVYGKAKGDVNFLGGRDQVTYKVALADQTGPLIVRAALLYNSISYHFMQDLQEDGQLSLVERFNRYYEKADKTPVTIAAWQAEIR
jgi:hypothetical protein